jgi:hypothetical protein
MGKGLDIQPSGTHVAFTGGTGCLVFVDLVAHLIQKNLGLLGKDENVQLKADFKFIFYVSFPKREEGIAVELCEGLQRVCNARELKNFQFMPRYSNELKQRWDASFINSALDISNVGKDLKRVWVCGPPIMNELFDRHLLTMPNKSFKYEIL